MRVHITSIYGQSPRSIALISQKLVKDVGRQLGYDEMGIYFYNDHAETHGERSTRMDGIIAGLGRGDIVVFQVPTWNSTEFDELFLDKLQAYGARIITFVHDIVPLMFESNFY
ncbi:beta-1,6-galactofuranosyltransferase, partial [Streptococcus agalactiae]|nr:beta-1,6-galactofuranosyltransferase [Streptococcus agalactiae]